MQTSRPAAVDLHWIPVGAGGHSVRFNGWVFESIEAARQRRRRCDLYHSALVVECDGEDHTVEVAPSPDADEASRGVVATGAVGSRHAGWLRLFRYEVRCWRGGSIPDLGDAVGGSHRLTSDPRTARRLLDLVATVPTPVWGRDELQAGEMWNSNSMVAWLIFTSGLSTEPHAATAARSRSGLARRSRSGSAATPGHFVARELGETTCVRWGQDDPVRRRVLGWDRKVVRLPFPAGAANTSRFTCWSQLAEAIESEAGQRAIGGWAQAHGLGLEVLGDCVRAHRFLGRRRGDLRAAHESPGSEPRISQSTISTRRFNRSGQGGR